MPPMAYLTGFFSAALSLQPQSTWLLYSFNGSQVPQWRRGVMRLNSVRGRDCGKRDVAMRIADIEELKSAAGRGVCSGMLSMSGDNPSRNFS